MLLTYCVNHQYLTKTLYVWVPGVPKSEYVHAFIMAVDEIGDHVILKKVGLKLKEISDIVNKEAKSIKDTKDEIIVG